MLISIVTVCFNEQYNIKKTIESVLNQTSNNYEYFIMDGGSTDNTVETVNSYSSVFKIRNIRYEVSSEPDTGLYNAMNKAIEKVSGEWIIFMNAGDKFANDSVLKTMINYIEKIDTEIIYGDTILNYRNLYKLKKPEPLETITCGLPFCHQSVFCRKSVLEKFGFDEQYKICADYKLFLQAYLLGKSFFYVPFPVSIFSVEGISSTFDGRLNMQNEIVDIVEECNLSSEDIEYNRNKQKEVQNNNNKKKWLHEIFPKKIQIIIKTIKYRKQGWKTTLDAINEVV